MDEHKSQLQLFEGRKVRTVWNEEVQEWFFSVVDVVAVLTGSADPKQYIKKCVRVIQNGMTGGVQFVPLLESLAEETATQLSKERNPDGLVENAAVAKEGAEVARDARENVEKRLGRSIISSERAIDHTNPSDSLPLNQPGEFGDDESIL